MTKEELIEYRELQQEIKRLSKRIDRLSDVNQERLSDTVKGSSAEFPYTEHSIKIEGFDAGKRSKSIDKLGRILSTQVERSMQKTLDIADFICNIESAKVRVIFEYRYYDLMTWQQIAFKRGWSDESTPREIHDKYLNNINQSRISPNKSC